MRCVQGVDDDVVGRGRAQADSLSRVALAHPEPVAAVLLHVSRLGQVGQQLIGERDLAEALLAAEGQLEGCAGQVAGENGQVIGVDQSVLWAALQHVLRMGDDVLIQCAS